MAVTKIINGKQYQFYQTYKDEKKANQRARWFRDGGVAARIIKDNTNQWTVWFRRRGRK